MPVAFPYKSNGHMLYDLSAQFPRFAFSSGIRPDTRKLYVFVYTHVELGTNIPAGPEIACIEYDPQDENSLEVLVAKIALLHG